MVVVRKQTVALYAERDTHQWIVRDTDGKYWILPSTEAAWERRQPFQPSEETELEPIPGHYKYMLGIPT